MVVLLSQDGQLARLLLFEAFEDGFVVGFWSALQQVVPQSFVLTSLDLTRLLELTLDLQLFGLKNQTFIQVKHPVGPDVLQPPSFTNLEALGLLPDLHRVFLSKFLLPTFVVLHLVSELSLMLRSDQLGSSSLHRVQLPELQLLRGLVVSQQHGAF